MKHQQSVNLLDSLVKMGKVGRYIPEIEGLPHGAFFMLYRIRKCACEVLDEQKREGVKVSTISTRSRVSMPAVSQALRHLESRGLVERKMADDDRRVVRVTLTQAGNALLDRSIEEFLRTVDCIVDRMGEEETQQLVALLTRFYAALDDVAWNRADET